MTSSPPAKRFDWRNFGLRALSALILAPLALGCVWIGGWPFLVLICVAVALLAIEWGEMCDRETPIRAAAIMMTAIVAAASATYLGYPKIGWTLVLLGAGASALIALIRGRIDRPADIAFGVLYIGAPVVALVWLRSDVEGRAWTMMLLAVTWAADVGAFLAGSLLKGPKLWPRFSPNKTWSGFFGGLVAAGLAAVVVEIVFRGEGGPGPRASALIGVLAGLATMAGDLWESMLKRRFGVKDSGSLIPGHGGVLDRVDGLMFAALTIAAARLVWQLGGGF